MIFKNLDENGVLYFWQKVKAYISTAQNSKVDKVAGKELSTNDLTNVLKSNYDAAHTHSQSPHAPANAQKNSDITKAEIEAKLTGNVTTHNHTVSKGDVGLGNVDNTSDALKPISTSQQTALNLKADLASPVFTGVPAAPTATTGANTTQIATTAFTQTEIAKAIAGIVGFSFIIVDALPTSGQKTNSIYLLLKSTAGANDIYDEWAWISNKWELIGTTAVDLSGYVKNTDIVAITNAEIDTIVV